MLGLLYAVIIKYIKRARYITIVAYNIYFNFLSHSSMSNFMTNLLKTLMERNKKTGTIEDQSVK